MKILVADAISKDGVEVLEKTGGFGVDVKTGLSAEELIDCIGEYEAIIVRSKTKVTGELIRAGKKLKVIGRAGVGIDNVDVGSATEQGVLVMNAPAGNTIATAEHTMGMMLAVSRNMPRAVSSLAEGKWERKKFMGVELFGKVLGIIGLGRVGTEVAKRANAFGMQVTYYDPYVPQALAKRSAAKPVSMENLLAQSDYISIHVALTPETAHMIGKKELEQVKSGVRIVNCARGGIIDEDALVEAIKSGSVAGAGIDVFEEEPPVNSPLPGLPEVVTTPHLGASTEEAQVGVAVDIAQQVVDYLKNGVARNAINVSPVKPEVFEELKPYFRLAEKLGGLLSRILEGRVSVARIDYAGSEFDNDVSAITSAFLRGILQPSLQETVNYINASLRAKERNIKVVESKSSQVEDYANLLRVKLETNKMRVEAAGTLFGKKNARIVMINGYHVDMVSEGHMLLCVHEDKPGIVGMIGTILGKANINVARMTLGRKQRGGEEMTVLNLDSSVPENILAEIGKAEHILRITQVEL